jgi:hypothetical protein
MTKTTKILLAVSLVSTVIGLTGIIWGFGTPIGAIFFGLFLISKMLEKETALYDEEQRRNTALAEAQQSSQTADCCTGSLRGDTRFHAARVG